MRVISNIKNKMVSSATLNALPAYFYHNPVIDKDYERFSWVYTSLNITPFSGNIGKLYICHALQHGQINDLPP